MAGRLEAKQQSQIHLKFLKEESTLKALSTIQQVFSTCLGVNGCTKFIHNARGGHVTITSSAARLLGASQIKHPVLKLIATGIQRHIELYSDGGTMAGSLTLFIIQDALKLDIQQHLMVEIIDLVAEEFEKYMNSTDCPSRVWITLDRLDQLLQLVHGVIAPKAGSCGMDERDVHHIISCIVEAFLKTFQEESSMNSIQYLCNEGKRTVNSYSLDGMLIESPHLPTYRKSPLIAKTVGTGPHVGSISVVVFSVSMTGRGTDEYNNAEIEICTNECPNDIIIDRIKSLVSEIVDLGVGILACQKVMHPKIKRFLVNQGVIVLDRLGLQQAKLLQSIAGGRLVHSLVKCDQNDIGYLKSVSHVVQNNKSFLRVIGSVSSVCTLVLCGPSEESLSELKHVCVVANHVLVQAISCRLALIGAGVWQKDFANHLISEMNNLSSVWSQTLECNPLQVSSTINCITKSLLRIHKIINPTEFLSSVENYESKVLDAFLPGVNAVKSALFLAHMVLGIHNLLEDVN